MPNAFSSPPTIPGTADEARGSDLNGTEFLVWQTLVDFARNNAGGGGARLVSQTVTLPMSTVRRAIASLGRLGYVVPASRTEPLMILRIPAWDAAPAARQGRRPTHYDLHSPGLPPEEDKTAGPPLGTEHIRPRLRSCLGCGVRFHSQGAHERMCSNCKQRDVLQGYDDHFAIAGDGRVVPQGNAPE